MIVDGTKPGAPACSASPATRTTDASAPTAQPNGRNGIVDLEGQRRERRQPHRVQLPRREGRHRATRSGGTAVRVGEDRHARVLGQLPHRDVDLLRRREDRRAVRHLLVGTRPGRPSWTNTYASNFNDSGMYVGACLQVCNITIDHAWMEYNALGYSGTNSGGAIVIKNSEFDNNEDGLDTNTQIGGDPPAPQNGACPNNGDQPDHAHALVLGASSTTTCTTTTTPTFPRQGSASAGPVGTGMTLSGGRNDTVMDNTFANNGAWGILVRPLSRQRHARSSARRAAGTGGVRDRGRSAASTTPRATRCCTTRSRTTATSGTRRTSTSARSRSPRTSRELLRRQHRPRRQRAGQPGAAQPTCGPLTTAANTGGPLLGQVLCDTGFGTLPGRARSTRSRPAS